MILAHGTSHKALLSIMDYGLEPRGNQVGSKGNWKDHPSMPELVYLTTAYATFFSTATKKRGNALAFAVVNLASLDITNLLADEDAVTQCGSPFDFKAGGAVTYLQTLQSKGYGGSWSLKTIGNVSHLGKISPKHIEYGVVLPRGVPNLWMICDPSISVMNFKICGAMYRALQTIILDRTVTDTKSNRYKALRHDFMAGILSPPQYKKEMVKRLDDMMATMYNERVILG